MNEHVSMQVISTEEQTLCSRKGVAGLPFLGGFVFMYGLLRPARLVGED